MKRCSWHDWSSVNFYTALRINLNLDEEALEIKNGDEEVHHHRHPPLPFLVHTKSLVPLGTQIKQTIWAELVIFMMLKWVACLFLWTGKHLWVSVATKNRSKCIWYGCVNFQVCLTVLDLDSNLKSRQVKELLFMESVSQPSPCPSGIYGLGSICLM